MVVAALLPWFTNPSAVQRVRGIVDGLSGSQYDLMVFDIESEDRQRRAFELFDRGDRADGLLVVSTLPPEPEVERLRAAGIPCVLIDARAPVASRASRSTTSPAARSRRGTSSSSATGASP